MGIRYEELGNKFKATISHIDGLWDNVNVIVLGKEWYSEDAFRYKVQLSEDVDVKYTNISYKKGHIMYIFPNTLMQEEN